MQPYQSTGAVQAGLVSATLGSGITAVGLMFLAPESRVVQCAIFAAAFSGIFAGIAAFIMSQTPHPRPPLWLRLGSVIGALMLVFLTINPSSSVGALAGWVMVSAGMLGIAWYGIAEGLTLPLRHWLEPKSGAEPDLPRWHPDHPDNLK